MDEFLQRMGEMFECILFTASLAKVSAPEDYVTQEAMRAAGAGSLSVIFHLHPSVLSFVPGMVSRLNCSSISAGTDDLTC